MASKVVVAPKQKVKERKLQSPLKRFELVELDEKDARKVLAVEAQKILGYSLYAKHLKEPGVLGKILMKLEINPLDEATVSTYKEEQLRKLKNRYRSSSSYDYRIGWHEYSLSGYSQPIPEFVLAKAVQIGKKLKGVKFQVHDLEVRREVKPRQSFDPFLVAVYKDETYYVEVWNEPGFENKLY